MHDIAIGPSAFCKNFYSCYFVDQVWRSAQKQRSEWLGLLVAVGSASVAVLALLVLGRAAAEQNAFERVGVVRNCVIPCPPD